MIHTRLLLSVFASLLFLHLPTLAFSESLSEAEIDEYTISIAEEEMNFTDNPVKALTVNGSIPAPTLELQEGHVARIHVQNELDTETSIHWHGILLPNREDGVSYLTTLPIKAGGSRTFEFPIIQSETYWYHSHTGLQEQRGVYGAIVIHPRKKTVKVDRDYTLVLSDWTDDDPKEVLRSLRSGTEYYALKKGSMQSWWGALQAGA
ncbi:hypothetical protein BVY02_02065, partial [bacterium J17]